MSRYDDRAFARRVDGLWLPDRRLVAPRLVGFGAAPHSKHATGGAAPPAISFVGANFASSGNAVSIGSTGRQSGDLLLWAGGLGHGGDDFSVPTDFTAISTQIKTGGGGTGVGLWPAWKHSDGTETSIDGALAESQVVLVFRGIHASAPIGDTDPATSTTGATVTFDALTIAASTSWVVCFACIDNEQSDNVSDPSGMTLRATTGNPTIGTLLVAGWSMGPTSSFSSRTCTKTSGRYSASIAIELLVAA